MNEVSGEVIVAGLVTGTHMIEDINVAVPHQVAVRIPAEMALKSQDLWRGIQQSRLFRLTAGAGILFRAVPEARPEPTRPVEPSAQVVENERLKGEAAQLRGEVVQLKGEVARLTQELAAEAARNVGLQGLLVALQGQIGKPTEVRYVQGTAPASSVPDGVVGGEAPTFLPKQIRPEQAETQIRPATETSERSNVSSATTKLRELKSRG